MQSELKKYQTNIILAKLFKFMPFALLGIVIISILTLYLCNVAYAVISLILLLIIALAAARFYFLNQMNSFIDVVKVLDINLGDNDMIQTVMELNAPDDSLVQQELFEQAQIKLQPIYKKAEAKHLAEKDKGTKVGGVSLVIYLLICLLAFIFSNVVQPPPSNTDTKNKTSQSNKKSSPQASKVQKPSSQGSAKGGKKGKGKGKAKGKKSNSSKKGSGKAKPNSKAKPSNTKSPATEKAKVSVKKGDKVKQKKQKQLQKSPVKNTKTKKKQKAPSKTTPKKSKDWQKSSKGKWDKSSKGKSLGTGKVKDPLVDKRVLSTANYTQSGEKLLTGVKKMTIPQKYKNKILKIHDELRRASKNSKNVYYPSKGNR